MQTSSYIISVIDKLYNMFIEVTNYLLDIFMLLKTKTNSTRVLNTSFSIKQD